jgi:hypothetical protein
VNILIDTSVWFLALRRDDSPDCQSGFIALHRTSRTLDAIVKDSTGPVPTAGAFPWFSKREKAPARRLRHIPSGTIRMFPGKPAARGPG